MDTLGRKHALIGALLKAHRESLDISQRDVATVLGYRNVNFLSMVESGRSNIPVGRMVEFLSAYQIDTRLLICILKQTYPDLYHIIIRIIDDNKTLLRKSTDVIEAEIEKMFVDILKKYDIDLADF